MTFLKPLFKKHDIDLATIQVKLIAFNRTNIESESE